MFSKLFNVFKCLFRPVCGQEAEAQFEKAAPAGQDARSATHRRVVSAPGSGTFVGTVSVARSNSVLAHSAVNDHPLPSSLQIGPITYVFIETVGDWRHSQGRPRVLVVKALDKSNYILDDVPLIEDGRLRNMIDKHSVIREEIAILREIRQIQCPFYAEILDYRQDMHWCYIFMEHYPQSLVSRLRDLSESNQPIDPELVKLYCAQLIAAVSILHEKMIFHRDIKPENIMIDARGHLKLIDFGLATRGRCIIDSDGRGSVGYMAPEVVPKYMVASYQADLADVYSLGVVFAELFTCPNNKDIFTRDFGSFRIPPRLWERFDARAANMVQSMTKEVAGERNTAREILDHAYFEGMDRSDVLSLRLEPSYKPAPRQYTNSIPL
ncbi:kinase-like domain-containing protein [Desarmillaria tabescens]|uniref:Kinase-like domain-containing protein n=1 Tax=Armillaria tabescens TaxID=1929756 RepID=A0AA39KAY1_ARMTA|nr:kinase-like domain-containing protein [Desarmillaria tabescens]KAK0457814.1 kinase-like domain-containing protein [Desarmillaria tabescens]